MEDEPLVTPPSITVMVGHPERLMNEIGLSDLERPISDDIIAAKFYNNGFLDL